MRSKFVPWRPTLNLTGVAHYSVDCSGVTGQIMSHRDEWDAIEDNSFPSVRCTVVLKRSQLTQAVLHKAWHMLSSTSPCAQLEGLSFVFRSLGNLQLTPDLDTPSYTVLKRTAEYEIRRYEPYIVAEVQMPSGAGPAAGDGFNELARYIFGGNDRRVMLKGTQGSASRAQDFAACLGSSEYKDFASAEVVEGQPSANKPNTISNLRACRQQQMKMTSPVFSTAGQRQTIATDQAPRVARMQFPMESKYSSLDSLPLPQDTRYVVANCSL